MKDLILTIYSKITAKVFKYEHLGHVALGVIQPDQESMNRSAIYSTGLFSNKLFEIQPTKPFVVSYENESEVFELQESNDPVNIVTEVTDDPSISKESAVLEQSDDIDNISRDAEDADIPTELSPPPYGLQWESVEKPISDLEESFKIKPSEEPLMPELTASKEDVPKVTSTLEKDKQKTKDQTKKLKKERKKRKKKLKAKNSSSSNTKQQIQRIEEELSPFNIWLASLSTLEGSTYLEKAKKKKKKKLKKKKKSKNLSAVEKSARESITPDEDIASETLAIILHKQGHLERALEMYKKLLKADPDKKDYFQNKISKIENELK